jgi:hypothetical protein
MSPSRSASASTGSGGGRAALTALVVVGVAVGMLLLVRSGSSVQAFDPRSSADDGATGAVLLLERFGATVSITSNPPDIGEVDRVLVIDDRLNDDQRGQLLDFVEAGGVAVVADPASTLHGGPGVAGGARRVSGTPVAVFDGGVPDAGAEANVPIGACTIPALRTSRGVFTPDGLLFPTAPDEDRCFSDGDHAFVVVRHLGAGLVIGFGDNRVVTNAYLRYADNASLITSLLAPRDGARVRVMLGTEAKPAPADIGQGDETLLGLVRPGVWMALTQLGIAFVVFCIARGVRPGRAVREPRVTPIAGNELVLATGNLMQRAHHHERAAWLIRSELHRRLCAQFRVPGNTSIEQLVDVVSRRTGVDPEQIRSAFTVDVGGADQLVHLVAAVDRLNALVLTSPDGSPDGSPGASTDGTSQSNTNTPEHA